MATLEDYLTFKFDGIDLDQRAELLAPIFNAALTDFTAGNLKNHGTESLSLLCEKVSEHAGLLVKDQRYYWYQVAAHPSNREGALYVPVDVHDLLACFCKDGFNVRVWKALACSRPPGELGDAWVARNNDVVAESDGLLPAYNNDDIALFTARGTHGTCAIRVQEAGGVKSVHEELAGIDGCVSKTRICEQQPSMSIPGKEGCLYDVLNYRIVLKCPELMPFLSRSGNNQHSVVRQATALQHCFRVQSLINLGMSGKTLYNAACVGMPKEFYEVVEKKIVPFVEAWAGGDSAHVFKDLEKYERTLSNRKKLSYDMLESMARLPSRDLEFYLPAMIKASLNSPVADTSGTSTLFSNTDVAAVGPFGNSRKHAVAANSLMQQCHTFVTAYCNPKFRTSVGIQKCLNEMEIRLVMHVGKKKFDTRQQFQSQKEIAKAMHDACKLIDVNLPEWPYLSDVKVVPNKADAIRKDNVPRLREIRRDGKIPNGELESLGYVVGAKVQDAASNIYTIVEYDIHLDNVSAKTSAEKPLQINRKELISDYQLVTDKKAPVVHKSLIDTNGLALMTDIWKCIVKVQSLEELKKSHEDDVDIIEKPSVGVVALRNFKEGAMSLVAYSPNVTVTTKSLGSESTANVFKVKSHCCDGKDEAINVIVRKSLEFPKEDRVTGVNRVDHHPSIIAFWAVPEVANASLANAELAHREVTCKLLKESYTFDLPFIRNTRDIKKGENIVMSKDASEAFRKAMNADPEPPKKKPKTTGKGKGKGKGK